MSPHGLAIFDNIAIIRADGAALQVGLFEGENNKCRATLALMPTLLLPLLWCTVTVVFLVLLLLLPPLLLLS